MTHLSADLLRRHRDEPDALSSADKEHLLACPRCRALRDDIAGNAAFAERALALPAERLDIERARRAVAAGGSRGLFAVSAQRSGFLANPRAGWLTAAAAAAVLALSLSLAPVRTTAANFLAIFEPHSFQPIAITKADVESLRGFPQLSAFGNVQETAHSHQTPQTFTNPLDAMRASNQILLHPRYLPAGVSGAVSYTVLPAETGAFTFSAAKTRETALANHAVLPPMPANLDGSTLYATFAPTVITAYGAGGTHGVWMGHGHHSAGATMQTGRGFSGFALFQAPAPRIYSTGASVRDIVDYLLAQPGVSPSLAAQIRAIGDPSTVLPIPIPIDKALAQTVSVGGSPALVVGDETGVGAVVVWERAGMVYGVAGPLRESDLLGVANSLTR
jgi:hypothetical protein